jgi:hypothetical protein
MAAHNQASFLFVARCPDEGECSLGDAALRMSEIELMKAFNIWRIEEWRITRVPVLFRRAIGCTASEKEHRKHKD